MQHIGRNDQIVSVGRKALGDWVLLDIQRPVVDRRVRVAEARLRISEKSRGDVGVHVVESTGRKLRQDALGRRTDAGAHFQHTQPPPLRQFLHERLEHLAQHEVRRPPNRRPPVEVAGLGFRIAKQQRQRVLIAAEHFGQGAGAAPKQPDFIGGMGVALA